MTLASLRAIIAGVFLAAFVGVWVWIAIKVFGFSPSAETPQLVLSSAFATVSGALSGAVGAGTAAVLGIKVQGFRSAGQDVGLSVRSAISASPLVVAGVLAYLLVGVLVTVAWLAKDPAAPEVVESFAIGTIGWMAGAFASIFAAASD